MTSPLSLPRLVRQLALAGAILLPCVPHLARAQAQQGGVAAGVVDSAAFAAARQRVLDGNGAAGRAMVDSLLAVAPAGSPAYAEALYWRAALASNAATAERDYRRLIVEYSLTPRAADAVLALAQLELARGDRASAVEHLRRFVLEHPERSERPRASLWLARALIEQGNLPRGCAALADAHRLVPPEQVELTNQISFYDERCAGVDTSATPVAPTAVAPKPAPTTTPAGTGDRGPGTRMGTGAASATPTPSPASTPAPSRASSPAPRSPSPTAQHWTVQIAAFPTRAKADTFVTWLGRRDAYVVQAGRMFRVRVGRFATHAEADALLPEMQRRRHDAFVTPAEP